MACYIMFGGFHSDFQNTFISAPLLKAPLTKKKFISARALFRENTVLQLEHRKLDQFRT